jgi:outer membrane biosynthesis protein TonB
MEVRQFIPPGVTVSAIAHVLLLELVILFSAVHPFGAATTEPIAVDLVTPDQVEQRPERAPTPQAPLPDVSQLTRPETPQTTAAPAPATPQAAGPPPQAARPDRQDAARPPQAQPPSPPPAPSPTAGLGYTPAQPDLTVKYNVMLGLPPELPPAASAGKGDGGFDATASSAADISSSLIAEFRRHLKTCSKLPASIAPSDKLTVRLRVLMTPDGRLAADPLVGGGSANPKALDLLQSAMDALRACQPYAMLPADRYGEWKVLDLNFTPRDFSS